MGVGWGQGRGCPPRSVQAHAFPPPLKLTDGAAGTQPGGPLHTKLPNSFMLAAPSPSLPPFLPSVSEFEQIVLLSPTFFMVTIN